MIELPGSITNLTRVRTWHGVVYRIGGGLNLGVEKWERVTHLTQLVDSLIKRFPPVSLLDCMISGSFADASSKTALTAWKAPLKRGVAGSARRGNGRHWWSWRRTWVEAWHYLRLTMRHVSRIDRRNTKSVLTVKIFFSSRKLLIDTGLWRGRKQKQKQNLVAVQSCIELRWFGKPLEEEQVPSRSIFRDRKPFETRHRIDRDSSG